MKPPLVFTTFAEKIPRDQLIAIAIAPLLVLDSLYLVLFGLGVLPMFMVVGLATNTIGAMGDVWIVLKLLGHDRHTWIQDTKTGVEVWSRAGDEVTRGVNQ